MTKAEMIIRLEELKVTALKRLEVYEPGSGSYLMAFGQVDAYTMALYFAKLLED